MKPLRFTLGGLPFQLLLLLIFLLATSGNPVPSGNEWLYQLTLIKQWHPDFLANDWTFASNGPEHVVFNTLFGFLASLTSPTWVAWSGRIVGWLLNALALYRLGGRFDLPRWMITLSIMIWLGLGQSLVGGEWIFLGFEAKVFAYPLLFFALDAMLGGRMAVSGLAIGACFSLHPAVGLWGGLSLGCVLLATGWKPRPWFTFAALAILAALPGAIPLLSVAGGAGATVDDWKFMSLVVMPFHLDPFSWPKRDILALYFLLSFNVIHAWRHRENKAIFLLAVFQAGTALWFTLGLVLRLTDQYGILKMMPFRLFPLLTPLFFIFTLGRTYLTAREHRPGKAFAALGLVCLLMLNNPIGAIVDLVNDTVDQWKSEGDGFTRSAAWISENTPPGSVGIVPPWRREAWYLTRRGIVANFSFHTYDRVGEWRKRLEDLVGELQPRGMEDTFKAMRTHYFSLPPEKVAAMATKYKAAYFVTTGEYPFPVLHQADGWKVYSLDEGPGTGTRMPGVD